MILHVLFQQKTRDLLKMGNIKSVIVMLILFSFFGVSHAAFKTNLSDTHVQSVLQSYFPLKEYAAIARVTLKEPKVQLVAKNKDIILMIPLDIKIIGDTMHHGHIRVLVSVSYKAASGGVYLSSPRMDQFEMPSINNKNIVRELRNFVETIVKNSIPLVRIYKLKESDMNHSLAKSAVKDFRIGEHQINLEFGFE